MFRVWIGLGCLFDVRPCYVMGRECPQPMSISTRHPGPVPPVSGHPCLLPPEGRDFRPPSATTRRERRGSLPHARRSIRREGGGKPEEEAAEPIGAMAAPFIYCRPSVDGNSKCSSTLTSLPLQFRTSIAPAFPMVLTHSRSRALCLRLYVQPKPLSSRPPWTGTFPASKVPH